MAWAIGYSGIMEQTPVDKVEEKVSDLARETAEGRSARTPALAITGVGLVIGAVVVVLSALIFFVIWLA